MECPANGRNESTLLMDYCAGKLEAGAAAELERHIAECRACQEFVREQQAVWSALDDWEPAPVPADFDRKLYARIEQEEQPAWWRSYLRPALPLALVSALALMLLLIPPPARNPAPAPQHVAQVEAVDAEHLEKTLDDLEMLRELTQPPAPEPRSM